MATALTPELTTSLVTVRVLAADGIGDSSEGAGSWIWAVVAGLLLSAALLGHAGWRAFSALPEDVRIATAGTLRRHPRLIAVQAGIAIWTLIYALYNLAYPSALSADERALASAATPLVQAAPGQVGPAPSSVAPSSVLPSPLAITAAPLDALVAELPPERQPTALAERAAGTPSRPASGVPSTSPTASPCQVQPVSDVLRQLDGPLGTVTGRPLGSEAAAVVAQAAGCSRPSAGWAAVLLPIAVPSAELVDRCGDVLGDLMFLRFVAPVATGLDLTTVDNALNETAAACRTAGRQL